MGRPIEERQILNFENHHDLFDYTQEPFNPKKVKGICLNVIDLYIPMPDCWYCKLQYGSLPKCLEEVCNPMEWRNMGAIEKQDTCQDKGGCKLRVKNNAPKGGDYSYLCVQTIAVPSNPYSIVIRRAALRWHLDNNITDVIIRSTQTNKCQLHHVNIDSFDDREGNVVMQYRHQKLHGMLRTLNSSMEKIRVLYEKYDRDKLTKDVTKSLSKAYRFIEENADDHPNIFRTYFVNKMLLDKMITPEECEKRMIELDVAKPSGRW